MKRGVNFHMLHRSLWLFLLLLSCASALEPVAAEGEGRRALLPYSELFFDREGLPAEAVAADAVFLPAGRERVNRGFEYDTAVWVRFRLRNDGSAPVERIIEVDNPLLETVLFYDGSLQKPRFGGMLFHGRPLSGYLTPAFSVTLPAGSERLCYIKVRNRTTTIKFGVYMDTPAAFEHGDAQTRLQVVMLAGMILALMFYSLMLYRFSRDRSYLYYGLYLFTLLFQQLTYVGLLPWLAPRAFTAVDNLIVVPKVAMMIVMAVLYARAFLKTERFPRIHRAYGYFAILSLLAMPLFGTPWCYWPEAIVFTGLGFVLFNMGVGIYIYSRGNRQARFFISGWVVLLVGYLLMILDALGIVSVMHRFPELLLWTTVVEAMMLMLAFADRINIVQEEKHALDRQLVEELSGREAAVREEVALRTQELETALSQKRTLFKELHHRVKNNLQIILSIIRLQRDRQEDEAVRASFTKLENRIDSIAKSHEFLCSSDVGETIDMHEYITGLCSGIERSLSERPIAFTVETGMRMALREAVYVGIIINELVSNAIKYAEGCDRIAITFEALEGGVMRLAVSDNGAGYDESTIARGTLGLNLVETLVRDQLGGEMRKTLSGGAAYDIRFPSS